MDKAFRRAPEPKMLQIDYLFLDLHRCTRCQGTDQNLAAAIEALRPRLAAAGTEVSLQKILVESAEQAVRERFVTSPTIRINGCDLATVEETLCEACSDLCGCDEGTLCRVWSYRGEKHSVAPIDLLVEAIAAVAFSAAAPSARPESSQNFKLSENLKRFFSSKAAQPESRDEGPLPCCEPGRCACGDTCDCSDLESADCGCHS
jgi:hypothetical protein